MEIRLSVVTSFSKHLREREKNEVAGAYDAAGERYRLYADGELKKLYAFEGLHADADRKTWSAIEDRLHRLRLSGARRICILDLGCGPGTWMRRTIARAHQMGFTDITARGVDLSEGQVRKAEELSHAFAGREDIQLRYEVGDIRGRFSEDAGTVDICLCLYGVLNHVAASEIRAVMREVARVTRGWFIATVRTVGSTPTVYVDSVSEARSFKQNNFVDRLDVEFQDGRSASFNSHLFSQAEVRSLVRPHLALEELLGLDLFHGRFARDPRWNPLMCESPTFAKELDALEDRYGRDPEFMDHATHLLMVASPAR
jgi:SAM-dependent methyltransferase